MDFRRKSVDKWSAPGVACVGCSVRLILDLVGVTCDHIKICYCVLVTLEYAVIVGDAAFILMDVVEHVWRDLKRAMQ